MRRVLAIGGGSFLIEDEPSPVDALILRMANRPKPRICFISTPSGDLPEHIDKFYSAFPSERCEPSHLAFFRRPNDRSAPLADFRKHILQQDVIYVGGGNTKSALGVWREWGLDRVLADAYASGVLLCGMSAGAMCWFEVGMTDSFWGAGCRPLTCLGLLSGGCAVHYNSDPERRHGLHAALQLGAIRSTIVIDDCSAVLFEEGHLGRIFRWGEGKGAYTAVADPAGIKELLLESEPLPRVGA
ncbi:MAG: peptidase E [Rubrivivax sp.]|nr:peptidase E [Rubrivivax sp.]